MVKKLVLFLLITACASAYMPSITNFNAGQVSPLIEARADFQRYNSACRTVENMMVTIQGPVLKRPGTKYIAAAKAGAPRLIPFEYSTDDAYIIEFGNLYARFYRDGGQILTGVGGDPVEITTVYETADLANIQYAQTDNELYLVDGSHPPQVLSRTSHTAWTIADVDFTSGPFLPANETTTTITPSGTTGTVLFTASAAIFQTDADEGHVGSIWSIEQVRASSVVEGTFTANGTSLSSPYFTGSYSFTTADNEDGTITLQRSTNGGSSWRPALDAVTDADFDNPSETEEDGAIYRVVMSGYGAGTPDYTFTITDNMNKGVIKIITVPSTTTVTAEILTDLASTDATTVWKEGYWSDYRGWPETVTFHQQRLVFGGSDSYPQTIWFGKQDPDDYANFLEGTYDTSAFTIALEGQNPIKWLLSQDYMLIGTSGSCGKWGKQGEAVTPTSPSYQQQSPFGAAALPAVMAGDSVVYIERGARNVRDFGYSLQYDKYLSSPLTILSPEITDSGITGIGFQLRPDPVLWCVLDDGEIATLTYQKDQAVIAWTRQVTDGDFESIAVISSGDDEDEIWVSVKRTIDGDDVRYIEQLQPHDWGDEQEDAWFVDSGATWAGVTAATVTGATQADPGVITAVDHGFTDGDQVRFSSVVGMTELNERVYTVASSDDDTFELKNAAGDTDYDTSDYTEYISGGTVVQVENTFTGLDHLEGETVSVFADGVVQAEEVVAAGSVTIDVYASVVTIGLPYTAKLETLPIRADPQDMAMNKRINSLYVDFYQTGDCEFGNGANSVLTPINFIEGASVTAYEDFYTSTVKLKRFAWVYGGAIKQTVYFESSAPAPLGIRAIVPDMEIRK
jgi:hypothetical protein